METLLNILITPIVFLIGILYGIGGAVCYAIYGIWQIVSIPIKFLIIFWGKDE